MNKLCTVCKRELPYAAFYNSRKSTDGKGYRCKDCDRLTRKTYRDRNREKYRVLSRRSYLKGRYDLTLEEYQEMYLNQKGLCAVCNCTEDSPKVHVSFAVDHNHKTGKVRGLLCNQCNRAIGMLEDSQELLNKAVEYLKRDGSKNSMKQYDYVLWALTLFAGIGTVCMAGITACILGLW